MSEDYKKILLVAITRLGDMLQASPTVYALKQQYPKSHITVLIDKQFSSICDGIPGIDEIYVMDLSMVYRCLMRDYHDIVDAYSYLDSVVEDLRAKDFDYCINMSSSGYTALLLRMLEIEDSRGWMSDDEGNRLITNPWAMLFAAYVFHGNRDYNSINIVDIFRCSAEVTDFPKKLMYEPSEADREYARQFLKSNGLDNEGPLVCIQVGASQAKRQWSPARFAHLTKLLIEQLNARVVYTGAKSELKLIEAVKACYSHPRAINAAGVTNLGQLGGLVQIADLLVTGDTGTMHMAMAVETPVVALFVASAYCYETGPFSEGNIILESTVSCYPCNPNYSCVKLDCHDQITPQLVADMVKLRLSTDAKSMVNVRISDEVVNHNTVSIKCSFFDEDGFLDFKYLNSYCDREGLPGELYQAARDAYRALWKDEFGAVPSEKIWSRVASGSAGMLDVPGLNQLKELAKHANVVIDRLISLIENPGSPAHLLGETNVELCLIDRNIETIGLSHTVLGAITRMFVMEKQNLQGVDAVLLAKETKNIYVRLSRRADKFGKLFDYYYRKCKG